MSFTRTTLLTLALPAILAAQALPKAETILDRSVEAMGGKSAMASKKTAVMKGTLEIAAMGMKMDLTQYKAEPNLMRMEMEIPSMGKMQSGYDGTHAWSYSAMQGPQLKSGKELEQDIKEAQFHTENWREIYKSVVTQGTEQVDSEPCHKVLATPHKGDPQTHFYNVKTGLLVKVTAKAATPMGEMDVETLMKDYKKVGDVVMPHTVVVKTAGQVMSMTFSSIEWNTPIPPETFQMPAEVKALVK